MDFAGIRKVIIDLAGTAVELPITRRPTQSVQARALHHCEYLIDFSAAPGSYGIDAENAAKVSAVYADGSVKDITLEFHASGWSAWADYRDMTSDDLADRDAMARAEAATRPVLASDVIDIDVMSALPDVGETRVGSLSAAEAVIQLQALGYVVVAPDQQVGVALEEALNRQIPAVTPGWMLTTSWEPGRI